MSKKLSLSGFRFSKIVIIQSLNLEDSLLTGDELYKFVLGLTTQLVNPVPVELHNVQSASEFISLLAQQESEAIKNHQTPVLQIECHGSKQHGLEFADGSSLTWRNVSDALLRVNVATKFNLLAIFSACFGAYFLSQMGAVKPCPCWCMVAPTEKIHDYEILEALRVFYRHFLEKSDVGVAVSKITRIRTHSGQWLGKPAEAWFDEQVDAYLRSHCTNEAIEGRQQQIYKTLKTQGERRSKGRIARDIKALHKHSLSGEYFDIFFMTDKIPENKSRFLNARMRLKRKIQEFKNNKQYKV